MKRFILILSLLAVGDAHAEDLKVESFECGTNSSYYSFEIGVQNVSQKELRNVRLFMRFVPEGGKPFMYDVALSPRNMSPGMYATATGISKARYNGQDTRKYSCELLQWQYKE